jgi:hypothetical protein
MDGNDETHDEELIRFGALYVQDLEINKQGYLSERQAQKLQYYVLFWRSLMGFDIVGILFLMGVHIFVGLVMYPGDFWIIVFGISIVTCYAHLKPFLHDIENGKIKTVSGILYKRASLSSGRGAQSYCTVRVQNEVFTISPVFYDLLIDQAIYQLYFTTQSRKVVNIDHIR